MTEPTSRVPMTAMTAREQVAIALRVPNSGTEWIDAIIEQRVALDFQLAQYAGMSQNPDPETHRVMDPGSFIDEALGRTDVE